MAYIEGHAREQALLLPASIEDYVAVGNPVRFIDVVVDDLDLGDAGFLRSRPKTTGRPGFDLGDLLKRCLYGYLNRVRSSRRLEAEAVRKLDLFGRELLAVDGTRLKAVNSQTRTFTRANWRRTSSRPTCGWRGGSVCPNRLAAWTAAV